MVRTAPTWTAWSPLVRLNASRQARWAVTDYYQATTVAYASAFEPGKH